MGAGKTSVGRALAARLNLPFIDVDESIEGDAGASISEIFDGRGEDAFRALERATVQTSLAGERAVIALGGGSVEDEATRALLRDAVVVYLRVSSDEALRRIDDPSARPMLRRHDPRDLHARRAPLYEEVADVTIDVDGRSIDEVVADAVRGVAGSEASSR